MAGRIPLYSSNRNLWSNVSNSIKNINAELGFKGNARSGGGNGNKSETANARILGHVYWQGTVDDKIQITVRKRDLSIQTLGGKEYTDGKFNFTAALPNSRVTVAVSTKKGRGNARVVQQPSKENDFTTVIEVSDSGGGAKEYELDIFWQ